MFQKGGLHIIAYLLYSCYSWYLSTNENYKSPNTLGNELLITKLNYQLKDVLDL